MLSKHEEKQVEIGSTLSANVLVAIVQKQADNSVFSEAECLRLAAAYQEAANTARYRRITANYNESRNLSIAGNESL